jgi:GNAT superfamily N-acetyltransferase
VSDELRFRRPTPVDHRTIVAVVDGWWGGDRTVALLLPRLWFDHFAGTSWVVESGDRRLEGFLVGFISPDDPATAYIHMVSTNPNRRRAGLGRRLYERFFDDAAARGARRVSALTWPGNRVSVAFHTAMGFRPDDGPGTQRLYGTPAYADFDGDGADRVRFSRELAPRPPTA